jgi:hypothetical protein
MKPKMQMVQTPPPPPPVKDWQGRMMKLRAALMRCCVEYVRDGEMRERSNRLREASDWSGIPITFIDIEERKR